MLKGVCRKTYKVLFGEDEENVCVFGDVRVLGIILEKWLEIWEII
jgi:hypothetical protein